MSEPNTTTCKHSALYVADFANQPKRLDIGCLWCRIDDLTAENERLKARRIPAGTLAKEVASMLNDWDERSSVSRALRAIADQGDARIASLEAELEPLRAERDRSAQRMLALESAHRLLRELVEKLESAHCPLVVINPRLPASECDWCQDKDSVIARARHLLEGKS